MTSYLVNKGKSYYLLQKKHIQEKERTFRENGNRQEEGNKLCEILQE